MKDFKIVSNGGTGALLLTKEPITKKDVIAIGFNDKDEVLLLQAKLNEFILKNYNS